MKIRCLVYTMHLMGKMTMYFLQDGSVSLHLLTLKIMMIINKYCFINDFEI